MPPKKDVDATPGAKLLEMFRRLMLTGKRHYLSDLADALCCSPQTVMRLALEMERAFPDIFETGLDSRRRWYRIRSCSRVNLGLEFEELRYLAICRDLAASMLPEAVRQRVDETILNLSVLMADHAYTAKDKAHKQQLAFFSKGRIDYTPHLVTITALLDAVDNRRICLVQYRASGKKDVREHRIAPGRMASMNGALYILGTGVTEDGTMRHHTNLAIHRIIEVTVTDTPIAFELPEFDPSTFGLPWHEPRIFRVRFKPGAASDYVRERIWASEQRMEELEDGGLILQVTTRSEPEFMAWVRSFGEDGELI